MIVVKVGGSLFSHQHLGAGLRAYLDSLAPLEVVLVPGGGVMAEAVRELDRVHGLGDEASHWLAIAAMDVMGEVLRMLVPRSKVLDCLSFARADESRPGALPHSWDVTSDSIAARVSAVFSAELLVLLKSVDVPEGSSQEEWARRAWVDAHFPRVVKATPFPVEVINFRRFLDSFRT